MTKTYTAELEFEVKMTSPGYPGRGASLSHPGDPPEPPEFEIETISINGVATTMEKLYTTYKAEQEALGKTVTPYDHTKYADYDQFVMDFLYNRILDQAAEDNWNDEHDDYEPNID